MQKLLKDGEPKVRDAATNVATCTAMVVIKDTNAPELVCTNITVRLGTNGMVSITPAQLIVSEWVANKRT